MDIQKSLIQFIENELLFNRQQAKVEADEPIFSGLLDSLDILRLAGFIEAQFQIRVQDDELVPENFQTVHNITEYIQRKLGVGP